MDFRKPRTESTTVGTSGVKPGEAVPGALTPVAEEVGVTKKLEEILRGAVARGATEVHLDPGAEKTRVRIRVQGKMIDVPEVIDAKLHPKVISRTKVIGLMDISKRGVAQKGYGKIDYNNKSYEMVMMIVPTPAGEKAMFRIGFTQTLGINVDQLGMFSKIVAGFKKLLERPNGLVLVAGPPGSGRTTTCYSALQYLNHPDRNVCSFEPEIRYLIDGVLQSKPEDRYNYSYMDGVRATLDLDPDVLYIGDLNGEEVARMAVSAAFGKRIVVGRFNAKNGATALLQLLDMGLPGFLVTSGVIGVLSQRLVRRLCETCRTQYRPAENVLVELGLNPQTDIIFFAAKGCPECNMTGFRGRLGVFELLVLSERVQEKVIARASAAEIQEAAVESGMMSLRADGITKVSRGLTTLEEVLAGS